MDRKSAIKLTSAELASMFADDKWSREFPPVLTVEAAAGLAGVPKDTIYDWSSRGRLDGCARKQGKRLRILRDRFIQFLFTDSN
jgi:excisionase family DNA binding protein